jgi:hypothetical protein
MLAAGLMPWLLIGCWSEGNKEKKKEQPPRHQMCFAADGILLPVYEKTTSAALVFKYFLST